MVNCGSGRAEALLKQPVCDCAECDQAPYGAVLLRDLVYKLLLEEKSPCLGSDASCHERPTMIHER